MATGFETFIGVSFTFNSIQDHCVACADDLNSFAQMNSYSQRLKQYFDQLKITRYDQQACIDVCNQDQLVQKCGCYALLTPPINKKSYCLSQDQVKCEKDFFLNLSKSNVYQFCNDACVRACDKQTFSYSTSFTSYPSDAYLSYLVNKSDYKDMNPEKFSQQSLIRLVVNYDTDSYTTITETTAMTLQQFIGQFGGNLGMFIGISVLSCLEVIELLISVCQLTYTRIYNTESANMINEKKNNQKGKNWL